MTSPQIEDRTSAALTRPACRTGVPATGSGYADAMSDERIEAVQAVVDRVSSYQDGAPEGTVEKELRAGFGEVGVEVPDAEVTRLAEAIEAEHGAVSAARRPRRMSGPDAAHRRPEGVDDATVEALGKLSEALEVVEEARGLPLRLPPALRHRRPDARRRRRPAPRRRAHRAGRPDRARAGRAATSSPGRWSFQVVEEYDDGYYATFQDLEREARDELVGGRRHLYEAEMKEDRRTDGLPGHEAHARTTPAAVGTLSGMAIPTYTLNDGTTLPAIGFGTYPLKDDEAVSGDRVGDRGRLPAARHRGELRQRAGGRRGGPRAAACPARSCWSPARSPAATTGTTTRSPACTARWSGSASTTSTCTSCTGPTRSVGKYAEAWRALVDLREQGLVRTHRRLELHRGAPGPDHRRDRGDAGGQPDRAAPLLPAGRDARRQRASAASRPSRGARWASGRRRSPSPPSPTPPRRTASRPAR